MRSARSVRAGYPAVHKQPLLGLTVLTVAALIALLPLLVLLGHILWATFGVWVLVIPLSGTVLVLSGLVARSLLEDIRARKLHRLEAEHRLALAERHRLAELEAAAGIALLTEGTCVQCGAELLAGAHYCSSCRAEVIAPGRPRICETCATRNLDHALYCAECGEPFATAQMVL